MSFNAKVYSELFAVSTTTEIVEGVSFGKLLIPPSTTNIHRYLSTSCLHAVLDNDVELHQYCKVGGHRFDGEEKVGARCKFCPTECVCFCH